MAGTLYVVATPIGNLEDISERARRVRGEAELVLAEDTRRVTKLLRSLGLSSPVESYHGDTAPQKRARIVRRLAEGATMALASDAGTPVVADPGASLVVEAAEAGARIVPVPGPSAVTAALSVSGLRGDRFEFAGCARAAPPNAGSCSRRCSPAGNEHLLRDTASPPQSLTTRGDRRPASGWSSAASGEAARGDLRTTAAEAVRTTATPLGEFVLLPPPGEGERPGPPTSRYARRHSGC